MITSFFFSALLAGLMLALVAAPLGCFVVWRRMAYFGDAVAHSLTARRSPRRSQPPPQAFGTSTLVSEAVLNADVAAAFPYRRRGGTRLSRCLHVPTACPTIIICHSGAPFHRCDMWRWIGERPLHCRAPVVLRAALWR